MSHQTKGPRMLNARWAGRLGTWVWCVQVWSPLGRGYLPPAWGFTMGAGRGPYCFQDTSNSCFVPHSCSLILWILHRRLFPVAISSTFPLWPRTDGKWSLLYGAWMILHKSEPCGDMLVCHGRRRVDRELHSSTWPGNGQESSHRWGWRSKSRAQHLLVW